MAEYIERDAVLSLVKDIFVLTKWDTEYHHRLIDPMDVRELPAADVVPVRHGRWERKADPYGFFDTSPVCSVCDCTTKWREEYLYCPNCGALMDKDGDT